MVKEHQHVWELGLKIIIFIWNKLGIFDLTIFHICVLRNKLRIVYLITVHPVLRIYCFSCCSDNYSSVHSQTKKSLAVILAVSEVE